MILAAQNCERVFFTENNDVLEVSGKKILLTRYVDDAFRQKSYLMGEYGSEDRASEVLREVVSNLDAGGLILPEE